MPTSLARSDRALSPGGAPRSDSVVPPDDDIPYNAISGSGSLATTRYHYELRREDRAEDQERVESFKKELEIIIKTFGKTSRKLEESGGKDNISNKSSGKRAQVVKYSSEVIINNDFEQARYNLFTHRSYYYYNH